MPLITLLCLCYAQHVSGTIMPIIRSSRPERWLPHMPSGPRVAAGWRLSAGRIDEDTHPSCLHLTPNRQQLENQTAYVETNALVVSS